MSTCKRDVEARDRDETETFEKYVSRPSRDRDVETETTTLVPITTSAEIRRLRFHPCQSVRLFDRFLKKVTDFGRFLEGCGQGRSQEFATTGDMHLCPPLDYATGCGVTQGTTSRLEFLEFGGDPSSRLRSESRNFFKGFLIYCDSIPVDSQE